MLLSDADRDRLVDALGQHAAEGRLGLQELERRVAAVLEAQSRGDAVAVLADLPPLSPPAPTRRWGRGHGEADVPAPDWLPTHGGSATPGATASHASGSTPRAVGTTWPRSQSERDRTPVTRVGQLRPLPPKILSMNRNTLKMSRKMPAAIGTALCIEARRSRLKSKIVKPPKITRPATA